jgi:NADH-quinone oxidoreductase subunit A
MDQQRYLSGFGEALLFIIAGIVFIALTMLLSRLIRPNRPNSQKQSTYESGEETIGTAWTQFNIRFYIVALIFLLFEVEIVFMFPWSVVFADTHLIKQYPGWGWLAFSEMILFIGILAVGLAYAWRNGFLDWVKPQPTSTVHHSKVPKELYDALNEKYKPTQSKK